MIMESRSVFDLQISRQVCGYRGCARRSCCNRDFACSNDESLWCCSDVVKGKACNQRERLFVRRLDHRDGGRRHDRSPLYLVLKFAIRRPQNDWVAPLHVAQWPEKTVAMACQGDVSRFAWQRGFGDMSHCEP